MRPCPRSRQPARAVYGVDDRPPLREELPLGLQRVTAMLPGNITTPILLALAIGPGLEVQFRREALQHLPGAPATFLASGLIVGGLTALGLNLALPRRTA